MWFLAFEWVPGELARSAILGLVQGLTEFLPISSSGHLILFHRGLGWPDQGLSFDIAANTGTLAALLWFFRDDLLELTLRGGRRQSDGVALLPWLAVATVPVGIVALLAGDWVAGAGRNTTLIAVTSIAFGVLLALADWLVSRAERQAEQLPSGINPPEGFLGSRGMQAPLRWRDAVVLGAAQAIAPVPGTSRSGIVMTAGMLTGFDRETSARLSFLMAIPVGFLATGKALFDANSAEIALSGPAHFVGFLTAAVAGYCVIAFLLGWLRSRGMTPFVLYRIALGLVILGAL